MQATARFHDGITNPVLQEADFVFHHPIAFHATKRVFNADSDRGDAAIGRFLWRREFTPTRFLWRLDDSHASQDEALEPPILIETTRRGPRIARKLRKTFILCLPFKGRTQEANGTGRIEHEEVFDRVALLLATVIRLWGLGILRAVDRSLSTIMPNRGDVGPSFDCVLVRRMAHSSAVRAGSRSWCAHA
jgi:hypothetical protein